MMKKVILYNYYVYTSVKFGVVRSEISGGKFPEINFVRNERTLWEIII